MCYAKNLLTWGPPSIESGFFNCWEKGIRMSMIRRTLIIGVLVFISLALWHPGRAMATDGGGNGCFNQYTSVSVSNPVITPGQIETLNVTLYDQPASAGQTCADTPSGVFYDLGMSVKGPNENQGGTVWSQFSDSGMFGHQSGDNGIPCGAGTSGAQWSQSFNIPTGNLEPGTYVVNVTFVETSYWPDQGPTYDVSYDNSGTTPFAGLSDATSYAGSALDYPGTARWQYNATFTVSLPPTAATLKGYLCSADGTGCATTYYTSPGQTVMIKAVTGPPGAADGARAYNADLALTGGCLGAQCLNYTQTVGDLDLWTYNFTAPSSSGTWDIPINAGWQPQYVAPVRVLVSLVVTAQPPPPAPNPNPPPQPVTNPGPVQNQPALVVTPAMQTVKAGESTGFWAIYYPEGLGVTNGEFVTTESLWSTLNPSVATIRANDGLATGVTQGSTDVIATYAGLTAQALLTVVQPPSPPPPSPRITAEIVDAGNANNGEESAPMPLGRQYGSAPITVWAGGGLILDVDTAPAPGDSTTRGATIVTVNIPGITTAPVRLPFLQTGYTDTNNQGISYWDAWDTTGAAPVPQSTPGGIYVATFLATWPGGQQESVQLTFSVHAYEKVTGKIYPAGAWSPVAASDGSSGSDTLSVVSGSRIDLRAWDSPQGAAGVAAAVNGRTLPFTYVQADSDGTEEWEYCGWTANLVPGPYQVTFRATWSDGTYKTATVILDVLPGIKASITPYSIPEGTPAVLTATVSPGASQVTNYNGFYDGADSTMLIMWGNNAEKWTGGQPNDIGPDPLQLTKTSPTTWQANIPKVVLIPGTYKMPVVATWPGGQTATDWVVFEVTWAGAINVRPNILYSN